MKSLTGLLALQRYRIGPNFRFVDVNRPRCPLHNNAQDGPLNIANQTGEINYFPSEFSNQVGLHAARVMHERWTEWLSAALPPAIRPPCQ